MINGQSHEHRVLYLMGEGQPSGYLPIDDGQFDLWPYRRKTVALLRRYGRASVEVGRLPSLLGREFFRTRVTSHGRGSFEDVVIFVIDVERAIERLDTFDKKLLAMNVLEEYSVAEVARLLGRTQRTIERSLQEALDELTKLLLAARLMEELPLTRKVDQFCQVGRSANLNVSSSKQ